MKETVIVLTCDDCHQRVEPPALLYPEWGTPWNGGKLLITFPNQKCQHCALRFVKTMLYVIDRDYLARVKIDR